MYLDYALKEKPLNDNTKNYEGGTMKYKDLQKISELSLQAKT
jgi:hypothetical protein